MMSKYYLIIGLILVKIGIHAQFTLTAPQKVGINDQFEIEYTINSTDGNFKVPNFKNFEILAGPFKSKSYQNINGNVTQSRGFKYILKAKKTGTFTLPAATININGNIEKSNTQKIEVVKKSQAKPKPQYRDPFEDFFSQSPFRRTPSLEVAPNQIFSRINVSNLNPLQHQAVVLEYQLYVNDLKVSLKDQDFPQHKNFTIDNFNIQQQTKEQIINNKKYQVYTIRKELVFPNKAGKLELTPFRLSVLLEDKSGRRANQIIESNAPTIDVKKLPTNKPESFTNQVGINYQLEDSLSSKKLKVDEVLELYIKIHGTGNFKNFSPVDIGNIENLELIDPELNQQIRITPSGYKGYKHYKYTFVPRRKGEYTIPKTTFSYFDIKTKSYKEFSYGPYNITVEKSKKNTNKNKETTTTQQQMFDNSNDSNIKKVKNIKSNQRVYMMIIIGLVSIFMAMLSFTYVNNTYQKTPKAKQKKYLNKTLNQLSKSKNPSKILTTINQYLGNKLGIANHQLNLDNIIDKMRANSIDANDIESLKDINLQCNELAYGNSNEAINSNIIEKAKLLVQNLDKMF